LRNGRVCATARRLVIISALHRAVVILIDWCTVGGVERRRTPAYRAIVTWNLIRRRLWDVHWRISRIT